VQEGGFGEYQITWKVQEPPTEQPLQHGTKTAEAMQHVVGCADDEHIQHLEKDGSEQDQKPPPEMLPNIVAASVAEEASVSQTNGPTAAEDIAERPRSLSTSQPTKPFAQMSLPVIIETSEAIMTNG
jgi:hypothetical protein